MKLSVIIPAYNAKSTIERCINGIVSQLPRDCEVIVVDDGSTDATGNIIDKLAESHEQVVVMHTTNHGPSVARNKALDIAKGDYITFADSDDTIAPHTLEYALDTMQQHPEYDILEYPTHVDRGTEGQYDVSFSDCAYHSFAEYWLKLQGYNHSYVWNKLYKRELFKNIRFTPGYIFEDLWIQPLLMKRASIIATTSKGCYLYSYNPDGLSHNLDAAQLEMAVRAHAHTLSELSATHSDNPHFCNYYLKAVNIQIDLYSATGNIILDCYPIPWSYIKQVTGKALIKAIILKLLGLKMLCKIINLTHKTTNATH